MNTLQIDGLQRHITELENKPPLILYVIDPPANQSGSALNVLLYGHLDKQPWFTGWDEGLSPTDPVIKGDLMYGRGSSDDGYAVFASMLAIKNC